MEHVWDAPACFWTALDRSWIVRSDPRSALGQHLGVQKSSRTRPDASPKPLWAPKTARDGFFGRFGGHAPRILSISECFFVDFLSSRLRRSDKIGISKKSRVILTNRLGSCVVQSPRAPRTSFAMTAEHYMFSLLSLRTHKPT